MNMIFVEYTESCGLESHLWSGLNKYIPLLFFGIEIDIRQFLSHNELKPFSYSTVALKQLRFLTTY